MKLLLVACLTLGLQAQSHSVTLTWTWKQGEGSPISDFIIARSNDGPGGPYTPLKIIPYEPKFTLNQAGEESFSFTDVSSGPLNTLGEGHRYCYTVSAQTLDGVIGPNLLESCATIPVRKPAAPKNLRAIAK